ncbi:hypothetical protein C0991_007895 [Blastosporella zonata]|nr:hypothetical protein C0991_007895 [Blastosporella zonata]
MAGTCNDNLPGTKLANCQSMADEIKACQANGKIVTISLGGSSASGIHFTSDAQAEKFADNIWDLFLGGSSDKRPFGTAVLDGVDLDIESPGSTSGLIAFVNKIRSNANGTSKGTSKKYYFTAAPQCEYPDANLGPVLNAVAFDAIYVQAWNFGTWDNWAKTKAVNKDVKIYIGAPASKSAADPGYVDAATLGQIAQETRTKYSSFGGVMLWDASEAYGNKNYDKQVKTAMGTGSLNRMRRSRRRTPVIPIST